VTTFTRKDEKGICFGQWPTCSGLGFGDRWASSRLGFGDRWVSCVPCAESLHMAMRAGCRNLGALLLRTRPWTRRTTASSGGGLQKPSSSFSSAPLCPAGWRAESYATAAADGGVTRKGRWRRSAAIAVTTVGLAGVASWIADADHPTRRAKLLYDVPLRLARDVVTATAITAGLNFLSFSIH
jgi:hypothetical protein